MPPLHSSIIAVVDINVFVSGSTIYQESFPNQVVNMWRDRNFQLATSEPILRRMADVYKNPEVKKITGMEKDSDINNFLNDIRENSIVVPGTFPAKISPDPEDNNLFSCAVEAKAGYIVSGDKKHVLSVGNYKNIKTISPRDFVEEIILSRFTI